MPNAHPAATDRRSGPTLCDLFLARARAYPEAEVLRVVAPGDRAPRSVTFGQLEVRARAIAHGLATLGGGSGEAAAPLPPSARVAILCDTRLEWVLVDLACVMAGLVSVPLYPNVEPATLSKVLAASDSQVVIAENPWQAKKVLDVLSRLATRPRLVLIDEVMTLASGASASLVELGPAGAQPLTLAEVEERGKGATGEPQGPGEADACWTICYTPGTEGTPKGVIWTHHNLVALAGELVPSFPPPDKPSKDPEVQLLAMPLAQALARATLWAGLVGPGRAGRAERAAAEAADGPPLVTALARSEATFFEDAQILKPTMLIAVPSLWKRAKTDVVRTLKSGGAIPAMVSRWAVQPRAPGTEERTLLERLRDGVTERVVKPALRKRFGGRCRVFVSGGAPLAESVQAFYHRYGIPLREAYGLVETAAFTHLDVASPPALGSAGTPLPGVEQRLGPDGELFLRGPQVSPGYWRDPAETSKVFDAEGWFATGDLARIDEGGRLFITGRKRDVIVLSNGRTLAPAPIEALLAEDPLVSQALVYGEQRDFATALIALDREELERLARSAGLGDQDFAALSRHPLVHARVSAVVTATNQQLPPHLAIKKHAVLAGELSAEEGTLTPTNMLRRALTAERYRSLLDSFYAESF